VRKLLLGALAVLPAVGCMQFRPVGILNQGGDPQAEAALVATQMPDAPPPPAPVQLVSANDIDTDNPDDAVRKLAEEIAADRKAVDQFPNYPKVSKVKVR
jgi:hypothetical protein